MKAHPECEVERREWIRIHKRSGHRSTCTRSTVIHRLYLAMPDLTPLDAIGMVDRGVRFETPFAIYERG